VVDARAGIMPKTMTSPNTFCEKLEKPTVLAANKAEDLPKARRFQSSSNWGLAKCWQCLHHTGKACECWLTWRWRRQPARSVGINLNRKTAVIKLAGYTAQCRQINLDQHLLEKSGWWCI
jgi:hypothetical protein